MAFQRENRGNGQKQGVNRELHAGRQERCGVCVYACMCPKVRVVTGKFSYLC